MDFHIELPTHAGGIESTPCTKVRAVCKVYPQPYENTLPQSKAYPTFPTRSRYSNPHRDKMRV